MAEIAQRTGWAPLGVLPWFAEAWRLPAEDVLDIASRPGGPLKIAVPRLGRIANFDDLDPLSAEPGVSVEIVAPGRALPGDAALVLMPGSKSTIADLARFRAEGWDIDLPAHVRRGGQVLGLCGGYQMLGRRIADPEGIEGPPGAVDGLGLLDVETVMRPEKRLALTAARDLASGEAVAGYEIHIGETSGPGPGPRLARGRTAGRRARPRRTAGCWAATCTGCSPRTPSGRAFLAPARRAGRAVRPTGRGSRRRSTSSRSRWRRALDSTRLLGLAAEV